MGAGEGWDAHLRRGDEWPALFAKADSRFWCVGSYRLARVVYWITVAK